MQRLYFWVIFTCSRYNYPIQNGNGCWTAHLVRSRQCAACWWDKPSRASVSERSRSWFPRLGRQLLSVPGSVLLPSPFTGVTWLHNRKCVSWRHERSQVTMSELYLIIKPVKTVSLTPASAHDLRAPAHRHRPWNAPWIHPGYSKPGDDSEEVRKQEIWRWCDRESYRTRGADFCSNFVALKAELPLHFPDAFHVSTLLHPPTPHSVCTNNSSFHHRRAWSPLTQPGITGNRASRYKKHEVPTTAHTALHWNTENVTPSDCCYAHRIE